jgi:hypothetical protein
MRQERFEGCMSRNLVFLWPASWAAVFCPPSMIQYGDNYLSAHCSDRPWVLGYKETTPTRQPAILVITRATSELSNNDQGHTFTVMGTGSETNALVFFISRIASFTLVSHITAASVRNSAQLADANGHATCEPFE